MTGSRSSSTTWRGAAEPPDEPLDAPPLPEVSWLLERFDDLMVGLIHYGSTAFGEPRRRSMRDFWVIVDDLVAFHRRFTPAHDAVRWTSAAERLRLNLDWPCFFAVERDGLRLKMAVVSEQAFCRLCRAPGFYVKGRMQKPIRILRASSAVRRAVEDARRDGVRWALDLLPSSFTFDEFLRVLLGLSYRSEIRPELTGRKVRSIIESGREELTRVYVPLLREHGNVLERHGRYRDTRPPAAKRRARRRALRALRRMKWSRETLRNLYRNHRTHPRPLRYVLHKILGEVEKVRRRR